MATVALTTMQDTRQSLKISVPVLGPEVLQIREMMGLETLSQPFEFKCFMVSMNRDILFDAVVGQSATLSFDTGSGTRYFNGIIGKIKQLETARINDDQVTTYEIWIHPKFWLLKFVSDCRIFQNKPTIDIIKAVLTENGVMALMDTTQQSGHGAREYCIQYNETCFDFVSRLMEEEGICYYFTHENGQHTMVLTDYPGGHVLCPVVSTALFMKAKTSDYFENVVVRAQSIQQVTISQQATADYNFTTATTPLYAVVSGAGVGGLYYHYPSQHDHEDRPQQGGVEWESRLRLEMEMLPKDSLEGHSTLPFMTQGHQFVLKGYDRPGADGAYILHTVKHQITANTTDFGTQNIYENDFIAFPATVPYRAPRSHQKNRIYSTQTARVTGKPGEEIWTDAYGRIKVKFHWDESSLHAGPSDDKSSCWIRVSEGWAGNNWGILFTPRIGMEVLVTFLDGDPDRPLVTGCVWNSSNMPPYLPSVPTKSTIKSRSTKNATDNEFNEFRYEDLRGEEQVYFRAQKDYDKYIIQTYTEHVEYGSQWSWIDRGNRDTAILAKEEAKPKMTPEGQDLPVGQGDDNLEITGGSWNISQLSIHGPISHNHYTVDGDYNYQIDKGNIFKLQKLGDLFQEMDQGNYERYMKSGHKSLTMLKGTHNRHIVLGDDNLTVDIGNVSTLINKGTHYTNVNIGNRIKVVDIGGDYEVLHLGDKYSTLDIGDNNWKIYKGNQKIELFMGDRNKSLYSGNETHFVNGNFDHTVTGNYTLTVLGNVDIFVQGTTTLTSIGSITMQTPADITMLAGGCISMDAGISISETAGVDISMMAGACISGEAGVDINWTAGACITEEAGAAWTVEAGGVASITAPIILLNC